MYHQRSISQIIAHSQLFINFHFDVLFTTVLIFISDDFSVGNCGVQLTELILSRNLNIIPIWVFTAENSIQPSISPYILDLQIENMK